MPAPTGPSAVDTPGRDAYAQRDQTIPPDRRWATAPARKGPVPMPTYRLGPASIRESRPPRLNVRRPLICEKCAEALGNVDSAPEYDRMTAYLVAVMWPEMKGAVERHESVCPY